MPGFAQRHIPAAGGIMRRGGLPGPAGTDWHGAGPASPCRVTADLRRSRRHSPQLRTRPSERAKPPGLPPKARGVWPARGRLPAGRHAPKLMAPGHHGEMAGPGAGRLGSCQQARLAASKPALAPSWRGHGGPACIPARTGTRRGRRRAGGGTAARASVGARGRVARH
jgi:hypothetical protein